MTIRDPERIRRPIPLREAPLRSAAHAFIALSPDAEPEKKRVVEAAVDTAYRVYDDYVSWGQKMAAQRSARERSTGMGPKPLDLQGMTTQWLQLWQELARTWMSALQTNGMNFGMPNLQQMFPFAPPSTAGALDFELETTQPARVSLHLVRKPAQGVLKAVLHREEGEGKLNLELDAAGIRIKLNETQAPGTYSGLIRDASGSQVGMLTITVRP